MPHELGVHGIGQHRHPRSLRMPEPCFSCHLPPSARRPSRKAGSSTYYTRTRDVRFGGLGRSRQRCRASSVRRRRPGRIVHDWFQGYHGFERVVDTMRTGLFPPENPPEVFTFHAARELLPPDLAATIVRESSVARLPGLRQRGHRPGRWRYLLPYMPHYFSRLPLDQYDLVISSSHACAVNVRPRPAATHICYCHTPMRYAWMPELERGRAQGVRGKALASLSSRLRRIDVRASARPDAYVADSEAVRQRIKRFYGRGVLGLPLRPGLASAREAARPLRARPPLPASPDRGQAARSRNVGAERHGHARPPAPPHARSATRRRGRRGPLPRRGRGRVLPTGGGAPPLAPHHAARARRHPRSQAAQRGDAAQAGAVSRHPSRDRSRVGESDERRARSRVGRARRGTASSSPRRRSTRA